MLSRLYKMIFDLGVCCTLGAFLLYFFGTVTLQVGEFLFLVSATALALLMKEKKKQFVLPMIILPALGGIILRPAWIELLIYLPVWGYGVYLLVSDRLDVNRGEFLDRVRHILAFCLILPIFMMVELHRFGKAIGASLPYLIVTIVSIVFILRHLRTLHRKEGQKGYYLQQQWEMMIFMAVCVLLTITRAPQNLMVGIQSLYHGLIQPILSFVAGLIGVIFGGIVFLVLSLLNFVSGSREVSQRKDELGNQLRDILDIEVVTVSSNAWILPLLYSIGVILGLIILFFFFRWLIGDKNRHKLPVGVSEIRETLEGANEIKNNQRWKYSKEPVERIRYYYFKYLLHLNSIKLSILSGDTTRVVDQKYSDMLTNPSLEQREASKQLKKLYRYARYQNQTELKGEEAEQAKKLYHTIKSKKRIIG